MVHALVIDLMGTLLYDPYREAIEAGAGAPLAEVAPRIAPGAWPAFEVGAIDEAAFVAGFYADPRRSPPFDSVAFHRERRAGYHFLPGMEALLAASAGRVWVATNYPVWIEEVVERFDLTGRCEGVLSSHDLGVRKPDRAFFERVLEVVAQPAHEVLFVDDQRANVDAARNVGMMTHLFDGAQGLWSRLRTERVVGPQAANPLGGAPTRRLRLEDG